MVSILHLKVTQKVCDGDLKSGINIISIRSGHVVKK